MKPAGRLRSSLVLLAALGVGLLLAALWIDDTQFLGRDRALGQNLAQAEEAGRQSDLIHAVGQTLDPQAVLIDGRRGALLESLSRAADSPAMNAWADFVPGRRLRKPRPVNPQLMLAALCNERANRWVSAQLTDRTGRVVASWPALARGAVVDLSHDPYFMALSDPNVGPGIVRHGYVKVLTPQGAPAASLVAACGVADQSGGFAGLLKINIDVHRNLFGRDEALNPLLAQYPGSEALLVLGDGRELYNSAGQPLTENLAEVNGNGPGLLAALLTAPTGSRSLDSYAGQPMLAIWQRVGTAAAGATPEDVLSLLVFVPRSAFAVAAPGPAESFYKQPHVIVPLALALVALLLALTLLLRATPRDFISSGELLLLAEAVTDGGRSEDRAAPAEQRAAKASAPAEAPAAEEAPVAEQGGEAPEHPAPAAPMAPEPAAAPADTEALDRALAAHEDSLKELKDLRDQLSAARADLKEAKQSQDKEAKAGLDLKAQVNELRSSLDASKREAAQKLAEGGAREARAVEIKAGLESKLKDAERTAGLRKDQESVRLAAVNTLSGELKATLEVIKNYISTLLGGQGAISDGQQEFLGVVINKSARLERLIGDLVEISEIGSGAKPMRLESLGLSALVQDALVNVRPQAENKNISLELADNGATGPVKADRERMGAVLRGLLTQAVKVSPRNEKIGLALAERDSTVELRITDSGLNLSPERAAKVFVQFHGVDSQAGPEFIGAGLRFNIFKSVVEAQGGTITIESQSARGKTFILSLPKDAGGVEAAPAASAPVPSPAAAPRPAGPLPALGALPLPPPPLAPAAKAAAPGTLPPPGALPPLGPPPMAAPKAPAPPSGGLPILSSLPVLPSVAPAAPAPETVLTPVVHKPAPLDEALAAPWKRKQTDDDLGDLADLISPLPADLPSTKPADTEAIDFDSLFAPKSGGKSAEESKTGAKPTDTDLLQFSSVFGSKPQAPVPAPPQPAPPVASAAPAPAASPAPAAAPAPAPLGSLGSDFDALFGPPSGSAPARPPSVSAAPAPAPVAPPAPPAAPKPVPPPAGFNTLDDLNELLGQ